VRVADMNRDGRADLVLFHHSPTDGITVLLSRGDGVFIPASPLGTAGLWLYQAQYQGGYLATPEDPYSTSKLGDFNGDGFPDIVRLSDAVCSPNPPPPSGEDYGMTCSSADLRALIQTPHYADRLKSVKDSPTAWARETISYSTRWSDKPEPSEPCAYPKRCLKRGLTVVRSVESRAHLVDPADPAQSAHTRYYSYEDPVSDMRGRGFLGFRKFRIWDPARPLERVEEYDNHAVWAPSGPYAYALRPKSVTTVVPVAPADPPEGGSAPPIGGVWARVTRIEATGEIKPLNGGLSYVDQTLRWESKEWEQQVTLDWGTLDPPPLNPTSEHIFGIVQPPVPLRSRNGMQLHDEYGNVTSSWEATESGALFTVTSQYDNLTASWLIGLLRHEGVSTEEPGWATQTRTMDYDYDALGRPWLAYREKNKPRPDVAPHDGAQPGCPRRA